MGYGSDSDSQSSTTKSGINTQNITIKDEAEQLKRTGKTAEETIAAIKTDITTDNAEAQSGKLTNNFDKDKVQKELDLQREVTESFGQTVTQTSAMIADKLSEESRKKKYEAAVELENAKKAREENDSETNRTWEKQAKANFDTANREAKEWETGGSQRRILDSALNVVSTFLAGRPAAEVVASGLSPTINHQIKEMTTDKEGNVNTPVNLMAHAIWGGIEAYAGNRNAAAGAAGAVAGEVAASAISQLLYEKSPDKLTQDEKLTVSTLSQAAASIAGGTLANNSDGAIIAAKTAKDAVENNELSIRDNERVAKLEENLNKRGYLYPAELEEAKKLLEKSDLVDFLRSEEQKNKGKMHPELKKYLDAYLSEIAWDIVHTEAKNGVRVTHEEALKRLYEVDLSKQMKPYYPALENAIAKDKVLNDNWSRKLEKSNLEAIALFGGPGAGTALVKGVAVAENAAASAGGKALALSGQAEKALAMAPTKAADMAKFVVKEGVDGTKELANLGFYYNYRPVEFMVDTTKAIGSIPKGYKAAFVVSATAGAAGESLYYMDGKKSVTNPADVLGSVYSVGSNSLYDAAFYQAKPWQALGLDTLKGVVKDNKGVVASGKNAAESNSVSILVDHYGKKVGLSEPITKLISSSINNVLDYNKTNVKDKDK